MHTLLFLLLQVDTTDTIAGIALAQADSGSTDQQSFPVGAEDGSFWTQTFWGHTVTDWAIFLGIVLASFLAAKLFYLFTGKVVKKLTERTQTKLDDILVDMLEEPVVLIIVGIGISIGYYTFINYKLINADIHQFCEAVIMAYYTIAFTWLIARTIDALIEEYIVPRVEKSDSDLDDQIMPMIRKGLRIVIWILGIIVALQNAGFNIGALIAGLGVGGLALALAAQDTVKNMFGGIMIFADKPFKLRDRIKIIGFDGFVEEIGIRSTRLRTLEGRLIIIPNGTFSDEPIENVSAEPRRRVDLNLGLTYDTTAEEIELGMKILQDIANELEDEIFQDDIRTGFNAFGDFALGIMFVYFIKHPETILSTQTKVNLEVLKRFNAAGLDFAFPTQTLYHIQEQTQN